MNTYQTSTVVTLKAVVPKGSAAIPTESEYLAIMKTPDGDGFYPPPDVTFIVVQPTTTTDGSITYTPTGSSSTSGIYEVSICLKTVVANTSYSYKKIATFKYKIAPLPLTTITIQAVFP